MPQFNMSEEVDTVTRADLEHIISIHPNDIYGVITELQQLGMTDESIDKTLSDLHTY